MDFTSRMAALLGAFRRERNGAVADSMRFHGAPCGLNYGVSLPTLRTLARAEATDHDFAKYLWRQDVRCLRLAALHIADPARLTPGEFAFWGDGLLNSEIAAEAAFALLSRIGAFPELFAAWIAPDAGWLRQYAALMAAARVQHPAPEWCEPAADAVHRAAAACIPEAHLLARGAVALFTALGTQNEENRRAVLRAAGSLGQLPAEDYVHEELAWRLEV
ncbi:MAG: DNA alkylation repair protein [Alistipes sp.]|uniref:DNA alkylation repair protein n=1 Tax=Alistipes sp. TaxID=1872444 RepID=UPI001DA95D63|nr:DNA alkylation repair protein [Alistipes sp.]MBS5019957.1 DNA alkylation repair protein [Alistipes sp.]